MPEAFEQLVGKAYEDLYRFALCLTGSEEDALSLVEEAFDLRTRSGLSEADMDLAVKWLFTTVYRLFVSAAGHEVGEPNEPLLPRIEPVHPEESGPQLPHLVESPSDLTKLTDRDVLEAFWDVHPGCRAPLALYYLGTYSISQIADILDTDVHTVRDRILRGKEMLNRALNGKIAARSRRILLLEQ